METMTRTYAWNKWALFVVTKTLVSILANRRLFFARHRILPMRPPATFRQISRWMMDSWISSPGGLESATALYVPFLDVLRPNMALVVIDMQPTACEDFGIVFIRRYRLPTTLEAMQTLQQTVRFSDFPDQAYLRSTVIPAYTEAAERQRPATRRVAAEALGMTMIYDRAIFPQKNARGRSAWCIGLLAIHALLPAAPHGIGFDNIDPGILQLLTEGASTREIAAILRLSPRTVEHRIDRLKARFKARNIPHLVALAISAGIAGIGRQDG
ncbi:helix-turn-helix transcriptional regulator [Rhizobiaceae bacterium BDR2-2]|uniref:Helix-turn-helix transcriptional regulator n=1 Tax=Ectorhizobium quercum TaxID=2965071 RepID=A0AAE3STS2_9HYPH|nr:helix-turn-helix transcriptional regulator [Ectorhizobium quercum]MCX8996247.1 helix-turn-helix transcriptional regulator [Ectorhizobium quercum]MCX8998714.1 helix-turn-helix transcriptional regulator [Ectorhizobium quercum]